MDDARKALRGFYEEEARLRSRQPPAARRVELRHDFIELLVAEGRRSVVDFGAGPGGDGGAFVAAGIDFVGLDLAHNNALLAREQGVCVVQGSIDAPPFRTRSFDARWSMSTLMHIPANGVPQTLDAMVAVLRPGSPLLIAMWGGDQGDIISEAALGGHRRFFSLRPFAVNRELLGGCASIEAATTWDVDLEEWQYQVFRLRTGE